MDAHTYLVNGSHAATSHSFLRSTAGFIALNTVIITIALGILTVLIYQQNLLICSSIALAVTLITGTYYFWPKIKHCFGQSTSADPPSSPFTPGPQASFSSATFSTSTYDVAQSNRDHTTHSVNSLPSSTPQSQLHAASQAPGGASSTSQRAMNSAQNITKEIFLREFHQKLQEWLNAIDCAPIEFREGNELLDSSFLGQDPFYRYCVFHANTSFRNNRDFSELVDPCNNALQRIKRRLKEHTELLRATLP